MISEITMKYIREISFCLVASVEINCGFIRKERKLEIKAAPAVLSRKGCERFFLGISKIFRLTFL